MCNLLEKRFNEYQICENFIISINYQFTTFFNVNLLNFNNSPLEKVETRPLSLLKNTISGSCFYILIRNSYFTTRALSPSSTTISRQFPSIRETG